MQSDHFFLKGYSRNVDAVMVFGHTVLSKTNHTINQVGTTLLEVKLVRFMRRIILGAIKGKLRKYCRLEL
jgi:hypothetical protein